ncbi:MAG: hypothetical protein ABH950_04055, partial [Candidatus Altiarchaeota archaeon]
LHDHLMEYPRQPPGIKEIKPENGEVTITFSGDDVSQVIGPIVEAASIVPKGTDASAKRKVSVAREKLTIITDAVLSRIGPTIDHITEPLFVDPTEANQLFLWAWGGFMGKPEDIIVQDPCSIQELAYEKRKNLQGKS